VRMWPCAHVALTSCKLFSISSGDVEAKTTFIETACTLEVILNEQFDGAELLLIASASKCARL
jgi:hypothetical protein